MGAAAAIAAAMLIAPAASQGATFTVTTTTDEHADPGPDTGCSLREAITAANTDGSFGGCSGTDDAADTIVLTNTTTYGRTLIGTDDSNASGDLDVLNEALTIQVATPGGPQAVIAGNGASSGDRVLHVSASAGTLTVSGVRIGSGVSTGLGGGVFVDNGAVLNLSQSTVNNNQGQDGGGLSGGGTLNLKNVTVTSNSATGGGGGILLAGSAAATLNNVTVANNTADSNADEGGSGGGLINIGAGALTIRNTIVGNNLDNSPTVGNQAPDCSGAITSGDYNLVENTTGGCAFTPQANDITGQDPDIVATQTDNEGHIMHALNPTSPARDEGNPAVPTGSGGTCETTDQRGRPRTSNAGAACDIGAFELQVPGASPTITDTDPDSPSSDPTPEVKGTAISDLVSIQIFTQANCGGAVANTGTNLEFTGTGITVTAPSNQATTLSARGVSSDLQTGPCSNNFSYTHDSLGPVAPSITDVIPDSPSDDQTPVVKGTASSDTTTIRVFAQAACAGTFTSGDKTDFESGGLTAPSVTANSSNSLSVLPLDALGNPGTCSSSVTYVHDDTAPAAPAITATNPPSGSNNNSPLVIGTAEAGSTVEIFRQGECPSGTPLTTGSELQFGGSGLPISVGDNTTTQMVARATDAAGNVGACGTVPFAYQEITPAISQPVTPVTPAKKKKCKKKPKRKCKKKRK